MRSWFVTTAVAACLVAGPVAAETLRAEAAFNTGVQEKTAEQPPDGVTVTYPIAFTGDLDGCTAQVTETLYPRDEGKWGIYQVAADVTCAGGGFRFASSGAWDDRGFHGAGAVAEGSGSGTYEGLAGRVAQMSTRFAPAADGTVDIAYLLYLDRTAP